MFGLKSSSFGESMQFALRRKKENKKGKLKALHPSFFLLIFWFGINGDFQGLLMFIVVVLFHEFGHYFVAKRLGYKLDSFFLAPYGVSLNYKEANFDSSDELKIAFAGPLVNFVFATIGIAFFWIFPVTYSFTLTFVEQSLILGLFNLLPCYPLDGGRMLAGLLGTKMPRAKAMKIVVGLNFVFSGILFLLFVITCFINFNPTFALACCFLLMGVVQTKFEGRYKLMALLKKKTKDFSKPISLAVNSSVTIGQMLKHIEVNKFTIFYCLFEDGKTKIIDEKILLKLSLDYPLSMTLDEIFALKLSSDKA